MANDSLEQLALHTIGGGWGSETKDATNNIRVSVIRGTDIPRLRVGDCSSVPVRYESGNKVKNRLLKPGDIVIEVSGGSAASGQHTGRALFVTQRIVDSLGGNVIPASFCRLLRLDAERVNPNFIVYQIDALHLTGEISEFENQSTGIANFQFSRFVQETFPCIDDLRSQTAIAHILGTLDDKIELNRRSNETLEAMARALFKAWFVDFEPVRAKMEGREPYLPADLWQLFPDRLDDEGKPEGWEMQPLDQIATLLTNSIAPGKSPEAVFEHYSIPAFDVGRMPAMEVGESIKSNKYIVDPDSVLVSKLNPQTPRVWLPPVATDRAVCSTEFMQFVPHDRENRSYLYCLMSSEAMQEVVLQHVTGTTGSRQRAQPSQIAKVNILTSSPGVVMAFNRQAGPIFKAVRGNQRESQTLAQLRDTLLPKLISGELRVPDAERIVGAAI